MNQLKRWAAPTIVVAAVLALAAPGIASASKVVFGDGGLVPVGEGFTARSTNVVMKTSLGTLTCAGFDLVGEFTESTSSSFDSVGVGEGTTETCKVSGVALNTVNLRVVSLNSTTTGKGHINLSFTQLIPGVMGGCHYASEGDVTPFTYDPGSHSIHVAGVLTVVPAGCGKVQLSGDFALSAFSGPIVLG